MCYKNFHCGLLLIANADTFAARGKLSNHLLTDNVNNAATKELIFSVDSATAKLDETKRMKAKLAAENSAMKQRIEQMKSQSNEFQVQDVVLIVLGCS
ncbi:uncharacterized protein LOC120286434 isoform X2 [Eucalyptus grandis]|uniref:uncharacterized protein LOC120286434 isoform X2 n=1 Tax=Eucalyptus grandis TaxID=71139 RepID=UPI00192EEE7F|nr:uncharacterized protein LOC120286434 isoform X2 [Eucalyptus grandis]